MSRKHLSYHYVSNKETDQQAYRIGEGKFSGIVWMYHNVKFPMYTDGDAMVDLSKAEEIPLTFGYDVLYNPSDEDLTTGEFHTVVGDILLNVIDESLEHDQIKINAENRNNNIKQLDS